MVEVARRVSNWIDGWEQYTDQLASPGLFKRWGGIGIIAAALERKVWIKTGIGELFPNLYIILCAPPGVGKSVISSRVYSMLGSLSDGTDKGFHLASSSVTFASVIDELAEAKRDVVRLDLEPNRYEFNSLAIVSNELGVLLPEYDLYMMPKLTDLYDGHPYSERRRTKEKKERIEKPQINLFASCTPSYLTQTLPPGAWDQGFLSRTLIAFSTENLHREIFGETQLNVELGGHLVHDLKTIFKSDFTFGPMLFTPEAAGALESWHRKGDLPKPEHPKLMHYTTRRVAHLLKLCMVASIAESSKREITKDHVDTAMGWLLELEIYLGDIFKSMSQGGDYQVIQESWYHFVQVWQKDQKPIRETYVIDYLMQRLPAHSVVRVLEVMVSGGLLKVALGSAGKEYLPLPRKG